MAKILKARFIQYKPFHKNEHKTFFIMEALLNEDARAMSNTRTGVEEIMEITQEVYDSLTKRQKLDIMVTELKEVVEEDDDVVEDEDRVDYLNDDMITSTEEEE